MVEMGNGETTPQVEGEKEGKFFAQDTYAFASACFLPPMPSASDSWDASIAWIVGVVRCARHALCESAERL